MKKEISKLIAAHKRLNREQATSRKAILAWRTKRGITLRELGKLVGVSHQHIANMEKGIHQISLEVAREIQKLHKK